MMHDYLFSTCGPTIIGKTELTKEHELAHRWFLKLNQHRKDALFAKNKRFFVISAALSLCFKLLNFPHGRLHN